MNIRFDIYEDKLPLTIMDKDKAREASKEALQAIKEAKKHWSALLNMPELADRCYSLDEAHDTLYTYKELYAEKIKAVEAMPLPSATKANMIAEWQQAQQQAAHHFEELDKALDAIPGCFMCYSDGDPESLSISPKDLQHIEKMVATIKVPQEAQELYSKFLDACKAIEAFHQYEREQGYNVRHFVDVCMNVTSAEDFARCFVNGTWKLYNK